MRENVARILGHISAIKTEDTRTWRSIKNTAIEDICSAPFSINSSTQSRRRIEDKFRSYHLHNLQSPIEGSS